MIGKLARRTLSQVIAKMIKIQIHFQSIFIHYLQLLICYVNTNKTRTKIFCEVKF